MVKQSVHDNENTNKNPTKKFILKKKIKIKIKDKNETKIVNEIHNLLIMNGIFEQIDPLENGY